MPFANINGVTLYYETYGQGEPVVFIHGVGVTSRVWEFQKELFSKNYRMIVYDLRGSGKSSKTPRMHHTAELMSRDLKGLVDYLGISRLNLVGISLGAAIAMKFAIDYPEKVTTLVLSGAFADLEGILGLTAKYFSTFLGRALMFRLFGELAAKIMLPSAPRKDLLYYHRNIIKVDKDEIEKYRQILNSYTITSALDKISAPTLILYGAYEFLMHKYGRMIHERVKNSCMEIIPGVGHGWNGENAELFNRKVLNFISQHSN